MLEWLPGRSPRTQRVAVAVVFDPARQKFLVVFHPRWGGYTFPLRRFRRGDAYDPLREREHAIHDARWALQHYLGPKLGEAAEAHWMDRIQVPGVSGRTGQQTLYVYDVVTLVPVNPLPDGVFGGPFGFLSAQEIRNSDPEEPGHNARMVTWTTWQVLTKLLDNQHAAVAIVCREKNGGREYLLTLNRRGQWFYPATRMGDQVPAERMVNYEFKIKADYLGNLEIPEEGPMIELEQATAHLGPRNYTFHLRKTGFPEEDLTQPGNRLEAALDKAGIRFCWVSEGDLATPGMNVSDTAAALHKAMLQLDGC